MQLFLLDHIDIKGNAIILDDPEIWQQAKKVLRLQSGDRIFVQFEKTRYEVTITELRDMKVYGTITETLHASPDEKEIKMIVAMPNKREKAELIVQKLTEIGISEIIFRPSERSVIKTWNDNKAIRLEKIMKEAVEQSRGWKLPKITFCLNIENYLKNSPVIIFDKDGKMNEGLSTLGLYGLIGPEGGRGPKDYALFAQYDVITKDLGATTLRMETAAIVGAWLLKNGL